MEINIELGKIIIDIIKMFFINMYTYLIALKIINENRTISKDKSLIIFIMLILITIICKYLENILGILYITIWDVFFITILFRIQTNKKFIYSILINSISLSINYIIFIFSIAVDFIIKTIFSIKDEYINLIIIIVVYSIIINLIIKIKRINKGITYIKEKFENRYFNILIINISVIIIFLIILIINYNSLDFEIIIIGLLLIAIMMNLTIQKSLQLYYKQKMLVKDLEETKAELEEKNNKIKELEKEIIKSGKKSHSISHRQKILEHKLEELSMKSEISEMDIKSRIEKIGKDIRKEPVIVLAKTGIAEIDDVLDYMKSECVKKKIDFQLQLSGNIYKMINNYVSKDELEILLADHIKNAIIAIEYSENINKSILVRLGRLDGTYGLYVYDSGIEFEIETFLKLGKKPATTHKDSGGTGMGFMNTFDTLRKHNASFIIEEYGKPVTDNFTKVLKFKFDNKNEFKICTYRKEEIEKQDKEKILKVENLMF